VLTVKPKIENKKRLAIIPPKKIKLKLIKKKLRARALKGAKTKKYKKA
jgi:hypothetical protein